MAKTPRDVKVTITADTSAFTAEMTRISKLLTDIGLRYQTLVYQAETFALSEHQVHARFYVRGGLDPKYATPAARDAYLRVLLKARPHGLAAATGFLQGWAEFHGRAEGVPFTPFAWHRYIGDTQIEVSAS